MKKITLTSLKLTTALKQSEPTYYVIDEVIPVKGTIEFPSRSVLDFRGGAFEGVPPTSINETSKILLNNSTVYAPAYCIFSDVFQVSGFGNSYIKSEWFKSETIEEHEAINRSLVAADGIPVHLESRLYELSGSIMFPNEIRNHAPNQTLVCPGVLQISKEIPAIIVDKTYINLDINKIVSTINSQSIYRKDTGILLTGNAYYLDISVNILENLGRAIAVIPDLSSTVQPWSGIQYCTIRFKDIINAKYCFYVDLFNNGNAATTPQELPKGKWFSEARVIGGKMSGVNGIYFVNPDIPADEQENGQENDYKKQCGQYAKSINGLLFENITFEQITGMPMYIGYISSSKFLNLRFGSGLPGADEDDESGNPVLSRNEKWIYLNYVSYLTISVQEPLDPNRILCDEKVESVIFDAFVIDNYDSSATPACHFDRLAIMPLPEKDSKKTEYKPVMTATSSIQPYNMTKTVFSDYPPVLENTVKHFTVKDLFPLNDTTQTDDGKVMRSEFHVLPNMFNVIIRQDDSLEIDLTGLSRIAPCVIDINAMIEPRGSLVLMTSGYPDDLIVVEDGKLKTHKSVTFNEWGLYRLTFDPEWNIVITKVTH